MRRSMRKMLAVLIAVVLTVCGVAAAPAMTVTFDDLPSSTSGAQVPSGYNGFTWANFYYLNGLQNIYNPSGYQQGVVSPNNIVFNAFSNPATVSDSPFTFNSAYFTGAWNDGLHIRADASLGGTLVYTKEFIVNAAGPTLETFNWSGIDKVVFSSSGGTVHPGYASNGTHFVMDNFRFNEPVPEPSTLVLLGVGALGLLAWACGAARLRRAGFAPEKEGHMRIVKVVTTALIAIGLLAWASRAGAATITYSSETAFLAALPLPPQMESFEGLPATNSFTTASFTLPGFKLTALGSSSPTPLGVWNTPPSWAGHATDGRNFVDYQSGANEVLRFDLSTSSLAFGLYITDWGDWGSGQLTCSNNVGDSFTVAVAPQGNDNQMFFGVINSSMAFTRVELLNTISGEAYGIDEVYFGQVPEPSTFVLLGMGALGLLAWAWRRKRLTYSHPSIEFPNALKLGVLAAVLSTSLGSTLCGADDRNLSGQAQQPGAALGNSITFSGLIGSNGAPFTTYTEGAFRVTATSGSWFEAHAFGNPIPDIFGTSPTGVVQVSELPSGIFNFSKLDLADAGSGGATYTVEGFRNSVLQFSTSGQLPGHFVTIASPNPNQPLDLLQITMNRFTASYNIDNIAVSPVPEPATTVSLLAAAVALLLYCCCRRRRS